MVYAINFPYMYTNLLHFLSLLEFNFVDVLPFGCLAAYNYFTSMLMMVLFLPILSIIPLIVFCITLPHRRATIAPDGQRPPKTLAQRFLKLSYNVFFYLLFLIYPAISTKILGMFQCETLEDGSRWLRRDFTISCDDSKYSVMQLVAALALLVYPIGTPLYYFRVLYKSQPQIDLLRSNQELRVKIVEETRARAKYEVHAQPQTPMGAFAWIKRTIQNMDKSSTARPWMMTQAEWRELPVDAQHKLAHLTREFNERHSELPSAVRKLTKGYELRVWAFEIFECLRKLAITGMPVFLPPPGSVSQLIFGLMVVFTCFGAYVHYQPFESAGDDLLAKCASLAISSAISSAVSYAISSAIATSAPSWSRSSLPCPPTVLPLSTHCPRRLCQAQIFFALLSSVALSYDEATLQASRNIDILLVVLWILPAGLSLFLLSPLPTYIKHVHTAKTMVMGTDAAEKVVKKEDKAAKKAAKKAAEKDGKATSLEAGSN